MQKGCKNIQKTKTPTQTLDTLEEGTLYLI